MTSLGSLIHTGRAWGKSAAQQAAVAAQPLDIPSLVASLIHTPKIDTLTTGPIGLIAALESWTNQDDDAHEPCSLTACRNPLHPGPCKGWKGTLNKVAPGTYKQIEDERVRKANERRTKRIADLKAQGKPIPRKLLEPIKPKPAPGGAVTATAPGKVNQQADLAGGQAHVASQAITNAAGIKPSTPLPLGPKGKKPAITKRGPAFLITQPKVTDTYKLDKADKITPQEWDALPPVDKNAIRNELTAIKARGFGPQQTKADALLARLPAPNTVGNTATTPKAPATPAPSTNPAPGKVSLGQAAKAVPPRVTTSTPASGPGSVTQAHSALRITEAAFGPQTTDPQKIANGLERMKQAGPLDQQPNFQTLVNRLAQAALKKASANGMPGIGHGANDVGITDFNHQIRDHILAGKPGLPPVVQRMVDHQAKTQATVANPAAPSTPPPAKAAAPSTPAAPASKPPAAPSGGTLGTPTPKATAPSGPPAPSGTPAVLSPDAQQARAVAGRAVPKAQMSKTQLDTYGKLSAADFGHLDSKTQATIRNDLANAKAKFLDPKKQQAAQDLLDRFGSRHPTPASAPSAPAAPSAPSAPSGAKLPALHQETLERIATGARVVSIGNGRANPGLRNLEREGLVEWDSVAKQFKITDAGKARLAKAAPGAPAPTGAKGYSDPQNEAVKAVSSGTVDTDGVLKAVGRLSPDTVKGLDDADRKKVVGRLAFIATHPKATTAQADKASALKRIIEGGSPAQTSRKWDHTPTLAELHTEEQSGKAKDAVMVADALKAAQQTNVPNAASMPINDRLRDLGALTKAQFDALTPDEQRKITDALQKLHHDRIMNGGQLTVDAAVEKAIRAYTGTHPALLRFRQAEADFKAGKISAGDLLGEFRSARVQAPSSSANADRLLLEKEAARVARDNPSLPLWVRATMIENPYGAGGGAYNAIGHASLKHNWEDAPRLTSGDISAIFRPTTADLAAADPIHAEAVKALRLHLITTGLKGDPGVPSGSPWSLATRNHVVDNLLHISGTDMEVPADRLAEYNALPPQQRADVRRVLEERIVSQTNGHAKTGTYIALRALQGDPPYTGAERDAIMAAAHLFAGPSQLDAYRHLDPQQYGRFPTYTQAAIFSHLNEAQDRVERNGAVRTWTTNDNALKEFPAALAAHLTGRRPSYTDRRARNAADIANYGTRIVNPLDRIRVYTDVPSGVFQTMFPADRQKIDADLVSIANGPGSLPLRYQALRGKDIMLAPGSTPAHLNRDQLYAIEAVDPINPLPDSVVETNLHNLSKADYDALDKVYRDTIDERIKALPGASQQQLDAKFHPAAAAAQAQASPAGVTPTTVQANVPPHVQAALDVIYGVDPKSHTMARQLSAYGALRGSDFNQLNPQEQTHLLSDLSFIETTAKGPSAAKAKLLIDRFTPAGTPSGQIPPQPIIPPANAVPGQQRYATPLKGLFKAKDSGKSGDGWITLPGGQRVWGAYGAAGMMIQHVDPVTGEKRYLMVQRGPAISDPGKWTFPGGASDSKETPHQGAARETIEELGLADDVFKDALVHGDFTYSIPNSSWAYTSVAVQVPTMIKPNLSTAHARAETSDAKWMTEAEIRALDTSGKLHHPIAGGKLEKNVISLFPPAGAAPQTLGQIVRPGPVSKRLKRLTLPPGGRQLPANFNAWTKPHKPSKGKDLIPDKATFDAMRQTIKNDRKLYDGKTADGRLAAIGAKQGFDDTPTVVDRKEIDRLLATGEYIEAWRGVNGGGGWSARGRGGSGGKTAADINEEMRSGPAYYGKGIFGNGYYLATQKHVAQQYSDRTTGSLVRILIPKDAITKKYDAVSRESHANPRQSKAKGAGYSEISTFYDPGRYAAAKGIDGIEIEQHHMSPGGGARHVAASGKPAFNWLNRSVLIIQKEPA